MSYLPNNEELYAEIQSMTVLIENLNDYISEKDVEIADLNDKLCVAYLIIQTLQARWEKRSPFPDIVGNFVPK